MPDDAGESNEGASLVMTVYGYRLAGERRAGTWHLECPWPDFAEDWNGKESVQGIYTAFVARAEAEKYRC